ncbi:hypothetical protein, partial [Rhodococcus qingshengii]|uniref:hypothetical protein n=1 Tax=Rhodococcus qingshengii TaxID=334542 RepID=UPI001BAF5091
PTEGQAFRVVVNLADGSQKTVDVMATKEMSAGDLAVFKLPVADAAAAQAQLLALVAPGKIASAQSPNVPGTSTPLISLGVAGGQAASF